MQQINHRNAASRGIDAVAASTGPAVASAAPTADHSQLVSPRSWDSEPANDAAVFGPGRREVPRRGFVDRIRDAAESVGEFLSNLPRPGRVAAVAMLTIAAVLSGRAASAGEEEFRYGVTVQASLTTSPEKDGRDFKVLKIDPKTGEVSEKRGVPIWIDTETVEVVDGRVSQSILPTLSIYDSSELGTRKDFSSDLPIEFSGDGKATLLRRRVAIPKSILEPDASIVCGAVKGGDGYLCTEHFAYGNKVNVQSAFRGEQWVGKWARDNGYPLLQWVETIKAENINPSGTKADNTHFSVMIRAVQIFAASEDGSKPPRALVHYIGRFVKSLPGEQQTQVVHVTTAFTRSPKGEVDFQVYSNDGKDTAPYESDSIFALGDQAQPAVVKGRKDVLVPTWERRYQLVHGVSKGAEPWPTVLLGPLPKGWHEGKWDGKMPESGGILLGKIDPKTGRMPLSEQVLAYLTDLWVRDKNGDLMARTPFGEVDAKKSYAKFKAILAEVKDNPEELQLRRHLVDVVMNWSSDMTQLPGDGPKKKEPSIKELLLASAK